MTDPAPRIVALYARVSTDDQGQNPLVQLGPMRAYAAARGWDVVEFLDEGWSGAKDSRPRLDAMFAAVEAGEVSAVLVWRFDRFARSTRFLLERLDYFRTKGVDFISVTEQVDTSTPIGKAMFTIIGALAEFERELLRERVRAGMATAKAAGKHVGRPPVEVDVRMAAALVRSGDYALREVAEHFGVSESTIRRRLADAGVIKGDG
jgi:DNA invertase Pin-like site-specific DNA recombinase